MKSKVIKTRQPCLSCGSSDARAIYDDGHSHCFSCGETIQNPLLPNNNKKSAEEEVETPKTSQAIRQIPKNFHALSDRRIDEATARKYGVTVVQDENSTIAHVYPYFDRKGQHHVANKLRLKGPKDFRSEGEIHQAGLFGMQIFPGGSARAVTLVEGECDAMAAYQMQGSRYPVVSVHNASVAAKNCADNFEYLNSFDQIVICFDRDEAKVNDRDGSIHYPGQEAAIAVANMFPIGKVRVLTLAEAKDPNDYLVNGIADKFIKEWWSAPKYTPTGLKFGKDMWDEIRTPKNYESVPYPWAGLNKATYGIRLSELITVTADTGVGKTQLLKEIEHYLLKNTKLGIGLLHLEEPNSDTALGIMSVEANKPLHLPDVRADVKDDDLRTYYNDTVNNDRIVIWDHFGSNSIHEVLSKIRHMHNLGCKYIVLDHLSIVVSDQSGDERKQLDEITTKIKTLCMELNVSVIAVIHQNRQGQIRGTAGVEQLSNIVIKLLRDKTAADEWRRNVTKVVVEKNRFCGITGPACWLFYDSGTGRLRELDADEIKRYEEGGTVTESEEERW